MIARLACRLALAAPLSVLAVAPACAHHVMGGRIPSTFFEGLLSGLGHPVIGPDHLAFLVAVGVVTGLNRVNLGLPAVFIATMALAAGIRIAGIAVPGAEIVVAISVLLAGAMIAAGRAWSTAQWATLFAFAGLFHGLAFGESMYGAEASSIGGYLVGLVLIQSALAIGIAAVVRHVWSRDFALPARLAGAAVVGVGFAALVGQLVPNA